MDSIIKKEQKDPILTRLLKYIKSPWNSIMLSMIFVGIAISIWVGQLVWTDITFYGKDLLTTLFGSRLGENISLGIGMTVFYYLVIGTMLPFSVMIINYVKDKPYIDEK